MADSTAATGNTPVDKLVRVDMTAGKGYWVGASTTVNVEAGTFNPYAPDPTSQMYVLERDRHAVQFGTYNTTSAAFTLIGSFSFSSCTTSGGTTYTNLFDADGLAIDYSTGGADWYGAIHTNNADGAPPDLLVKINPTTGALMTLAGGGTCASIIPVPTGLIDIDDMAISGAGVLYGIANTGGTESHVLVINKGTGAIEQDLGRIAVQGTGNYLNDVEGFSIDETGQAWATTGNSGGADSDTIWRVDLSTRPALAARAVVTLNGNGTIISAPNDNTTATSYTDYEAVACYGVTQAGKRNPLG